MLPNAIGVEFLENRFDGVRVAPLLVVDEFLVDRL
jgi:hypothetical protein